MHVGNSVWASALLAFSTPILACESCEHPEQDVVMTRHVRRMQPDAQNTTVEPRGPLAWGQLNVLHTTDTHGWLEGHIREQNYGADWGDYVSFVKHMRQKARDLDVDLLVVDTGDLHDGAGLSDATGVATYGGVNGQLSNPIFEQLDYDLLTIGNHELYVSAIAYETFSQFAKSYGERYLTSNVQIRNPSTGELEYIGKKYRYFKTEKGLRIMAFGVLFDFTGNSNASVVTKAADMVKESWFIDAVNHKNVDAFVLIGHNPVGLKSSTNTLQTVYKAIRAIKPDTPIQMFGGHTHIRDFAVYDDKSVGLESGRYCETLGWLAVSGINPHGKANPKGVPTPTMKAQKNSTASASASVASSTSASTLRFFRRYLDWNRMTFEYHAEGSQAKAFDTNKGLAVSKNITATRKELNLTSIYGCAPQTWCLSCAPFKSEGSIYSLLDTALSATIVTKERAEKPRLIVTNTGHIRFDLAEGTFDYDSSFIVSPFTDAFQYLPDVPYHLASQVLDGLENGNYPSKRDLSSADFGFTQMNPLLDSCIDPPVTHDHLITKRSYPGGRIIRRQTTTTPGYTTTDDFGTDGDDTIHSKIPYYSYPNFFQANGSLPANGTLAADAAVDLIFLDYIAGSVVKVLNGLGGNYTNSEVTYYLPKNFTTNSYLPKYAQMSPEWQANVPNCPVGLGIGYNITS
ncbi:calcineurin-like phosphoesterase [Aureobasidium sp. EXF-12298]|nr:calcineurin-like phosphoesterase [Aureobasidium sp. EXF-12298]KAI4758852.1 calcineurin-like phosphoesterase [Aureobasidium sp. EXF-12344]KAI4776161.1 calcineurin-like phosphoesterase [Aureobasidium sp. EXF-3400]